jgi:hypothetical protein
VLCGCKSIGLRTLNSELGTQIVIFAIRSERAADSLARTSFTLVMLAIAGGMALVLGIVGIYAVIAYVVFQ